MDKIAELRRTQTLPEALRPQVETNTASSPSGGAGANAAPPASQPAKTLHSRKLYPRVETIDASQGQESFMTIVDGSFQHQNLMGK